MEEMPVPPVYSSQRSADSEGVLGVLLGSPGVVLRRLEIAERAWPVPLDEPSSELSPLGDPRQTEQRVDLAVKQLRTDPGLRAQIETVRGTGYKLTVPARTSSNR